MCFFSFVWFAQERLYQSTIRTHVYLFWSFKMRVFLWHLWHTFPPCRVVLLSRLESALSVSYSHVIHFCTSCCSITAAATIQNSFPHLHMYTSRHYGFFHPTPNLIDNRLPQICTWCIRQNVEKVTSYSYANAFKPIIISTEPPNNSNYSEN